MEFFLAQINIAKMLGPIDSPIMTGFVNNLDPINELAEQSEGFIWRLKDDSNNATAVKIYDDEFLIVNMSVWKDVAALHEFVYRSNHVEVFKRRKEWFEKIPEMHMALWYVSRDYWPTVADAIERLDHLRSHGETPYAFGFKKKFTPEEVADYLVGQN